MSGGSSKSSSQQNTSQTTTSGNASGVVGDVFQGQTINITDQVPDEVVNIFKDLIGLSKDAITAAKEAGQQAIDKVSEVQTTSISPDNSTTKTLSPAIIILSVGFLAFALMMRK